MRFEIPKLNNKMQVGVSSFDTQYIGNSGEENETMKRLTNPIHHSRNDTEVYYTYFIYVRTSHTFDMSFFTRI